MVFHDGEGEGEGGDGDVFVAEVDAGVALDVAEEVHGVVEVADGVGLVADEVVEAVGAVRVDEAVSYPLSGAHALVDIGDDLEC